MVPAQSFSAEAGAQALRKAMKGLGEYIFLCFKAFMHGPFISTPTPPLLLHTHRGIPLVVIAPHFAITDYVGYNICKYVQ